VERRDRGDTSGQRRRSGWRRHRWERHWGERHWWWRYRWERHRWERQRSDRPAVNAVCHQSCRSAKARRRPGRWHRPVERARVPCMADRIPLAGIEARSLGSHRCARGLLTCRLAGHPRTPGARNGGRAPPRGHNVRRRLFDVHPRLIRVRRETAPPPHHRSPQPAASSWARGRGPGQPSGETRGRKSGVQVHG